MDENNSWYKLFSSGFLDQNMNIINNNHIPSIEYSDKLYLMQGLKLLEGYFVIMFHIRVSVKYCLIIIQIIFYSFTQFVF